MDVLAMRGRGVVNSKQYEHSKENMGKKIEIFIAIWKTCEVVGLGSMEILRVFG